MLHRNDIIIRRMQFMLTELCTGFFVFVLLSLLLVRLRTNREDCMKRQRAKRWDGLNVCNGYCVSSIILLVHLGWRVLLAVVCKSVCQQGNMTCNIFPNRRYCARSGLGGAVVMQESACYLKCFYYKLLAAYKETTSVRYYKCLKIIFFLHYSRDFVTDC